MPEHRSSPGFLRVGDCGDAVAELRDWLTKAGVMSADSGAAPGDATFDHDLERAVRAFQQHRGITADGIVGPATMQALEEAHWRLGDRVLVHRPGTLLAGDDVIALQRRLLGLGFKVGRVDGRFGHDTEHAVKEFQRNVGIHPDGTCGPATLKALARLAPIVGGGSPNAMRAEERIRTAGPSLTGKVVVIDAAACQVGDPEKRQAADSATVDLARRVEGRLTATGVQAVLSTPGASPPEDEPDRAELANRLDANLCISLHVDAQPNPEVTGVATYYYGVEAHEVRSWVGERFAGLVQREIVARTRMTDLRSHPRAWDLLRRTRMPAVRVELGNITNVHDAALLADSSFRDTVAEAVVVAVQRLYLSPEADPHTGVLRLDEIRTLRRATEPGRQG